MTNNPSPLTVFIAPLDFTVKHFEETLKAPSIVRAALRDFLIARYDSHLTTEQQEAVAKNLEKLYYTAPRHDELRNWLIPLLYQKGVGVSHLDWVINRPYYGLEQLWEYGGVEWLGWGFFSVLDPQSEPAQLFADLDLHDTDAVEEWYKARRRYGYTHFVLTLEGARYAIS